MDILALLKTQRQVANIRLLTAIIYACDIYYLLDHIRGSSYSIFLYNDGLSKTNISVFKIFRSG